MMTGTILFPMIDIDVPKGIKTPKIFKTHEQMIEYVNSKNVEGVVATLNSGYMVKYKSQEYCKIHKIYDKLSAKKVVDIIINNTFDDAIGIFNQNEMYDDVKKLNSIYEQFYARKKDLTNLANEYHMTNKDKTRKEIAIDLIQTRKDKKLANLVFALIDNKNIDEIIDFIILEESKEWTFM